jgi:beta-glucosidase
MLTMKDFSNRLCAAGVGSVMCAYNLVNNSYASQNSYLINKLLKDELGFQGFVMSDWSGQHTGVASALAGLDMTMPGDLYTGSGTSFWGSNLTISVLNGTVPEWRIDDMAVRIMSAFYKVGRDRTQIPVNFDAWTTDEYSYLHYLVSEGYQQVNSYVDVQADHKDLIRKIGSSSIVLLKNINNALPLTGSEKFTAIIGEDATANPNGPNSCVDRGCDIGTLAMGWGSGTAEFPYLVSPEQAIQSTLAGKGRSAKEYGSAMDNYDLASIGTLAAKARCVFQSTVLDGVC